MFCSRGVQICPRRELDSLTAVYVNFLGWSSKAAKILCCSSQRAITDMHDQEFSLRHYFMSFVPVIASFPRHLVTCTWKSFPSLNSFWISLASWILFSVTLTNSQKLIKLAHQKHTKRQQEAICTENYAGIKPLDSLAFLGRHGRCCFHPLDSDPLPQ